MGHTERILTAVAFVLAAAGGVAAAAFTGGATAEQTISSATLAAPTGLVATRPGVTGPNVGNALLSWTPSPGVATGQTVHSGASSTGPWTSTASLGAATSTHTDAAAPYNGQVFYRLRATRSLWTADPPVAMSLSLPMAAGTDRTTGSGTGTALTGPWTTAGTHHAALSAPDGARYTPGAWPAAPAGIAGVSAVDATHAWAVGTGGAILRGDGTGAWTTLPSGTTQNLAAVAFASASTGWAVGAGPGISTTNDGGNTWTVQASGTPQPLAAVACATASLCWAVGGNGAIVNTTNGTKWKKQNSGVSGSLLGVSCASPTMCVAVGASGAVTRFTGGNKWHAVAPSPAGNDLNAVSCPTTSRCWVVGASGAILASADGGQTWIAQASGTTQALRGVDMVSASAGYAVGDSGTVLTTADGGATWTALPGLTGSGQDVSCTDATHCVVVASAGLPSATADGGATWTNGYGGYLALTPLAPAVAAGIPLSAAQTRVVLRTPTIPAAGSSAMLLASADAGSTWRSYPLTLPTAANTDLVQTIDLSTQVAGATVGNLLLRLVVRPAAGTLTTAIDLVHVDAAG